MVLRNYTFHINKNNIRYRLIHLIRCQLEKISENQEQTLNPSEITTGDLSEIQREEKFPKQIVQTLLIR